MKTSKQGIEFIKAREGCKLAPYNDIRGCATIGVGHLIGMRPVNSTDKPITMEQAEQILERDLKRFEDNINKVVRIVLTQNDFDALVSFTFNVGFGEFNTSRTLQLLNGSDRREFARALLTWDKVDGTPNTVIHARRVLESDLFLKGVYK